MKSTIVLAMLAALTACIPSKAFVMKNPKTGEIAQCVKNGGGSPFILIEQAQNNAGVEDCAKGYEAAGWVRMNPEKD